MSVTAQRPDRRARSSAPTRRSEADQREYRSALAALSDLPVGRLATLDLNDAMRGIAARLCAVLQIERCAVYLRDDPREVYVGCAAHPGQELEQAVRRLTLGAPTDRITGEILATREPVLIRDARSDPRALTTAVRKWKLRSLLGVPMMSGDQMLGLMMLDNGPDLHPYAPIDLEIALAFAAVAASVVKLSRDTDELRSALATATRQNTLLRRTTMAEHRLSDAILGGGGLGAIVNLVCGLTGKPATLYDRNGQPVTSCSPDGGDAKLAVTLMEDVRDDPTVLNSLSDIVPGASATIEPLIGADVRRRHLAAPVDVRGERWGWLVIMEHPTRLGAFDDFLIRRAVTHLALELAGRRQQTASTADARALLARQLIRGTTVEEDMRRNAEYLGVAIDAPRIVAYLNAEPGSLDTVDLVRRMRSQTGCDVLETRGPEGVALLVEVSDAGVATLAVRQVKRALAGALGEVSSSGLNAGVSAVCRAAGELPGAYRVARQVARCIENFPRGASHRVLAADDLGPGRLFVANGHPDEMQRFVEDVLGRLLDHDDTCTDLVRTLEAFYDTGRSVRLASERLGVHENTVRYRLSRVQSITGLNVAADADDQLSVQVALLVLRLQGHPALRSFDGVDEPPPVPATAG